MTEPENKFPLTFTPLLQDSKSSFSEFTTSAGSWVLKTSCLRTGRSWWGLKGVDVKRHWGPSWPWLILLSGGREQLGSAVQHLCWRKCRPLVVPESAENGASFRACAGKGNASKTIEDVYRLEKSSCWWPWLWPWLHLTLPSLLSSLPPFCRGLLSKTSGCQAPQWAVEGSTKQGPRPHGAYEPVSFYSMYVGGARGLWDGAIRLALVEIQASWGRQPCGQELRNAQVRPNRGAWSGMAFCYAE